MACVAVRKVIDLFEYRRSAPARIPPSSRCTFRLASNDRLYSACLFLSLYLSRSLHRTCGDRRRPISFQANLIFDLAWLLVPSGPGIHLIARAWSHESRDSQEPFSLSACPLSGKIVGVWKR